MWRSRWRKTTPLTALFLAAAGCATVFSGTTDPITFESEPSGAMVLIEGVDRGRTPLTTTVQRNLNGADIAYRLEGYETRTFDLGQEFNTTAIANVLCLPLIWFCGGVDLLSGAAMRYSPKVYSLGLIPRDRLEEALDVEAVVYEHEIERDALGFPAPDQIRPNVALVSSTGRRIAVFR